MNPVPVASKKDKLFLGWYKDPAATQANQFYAEKDLIIADTTLYAKYDNMEKNQTPKVDSFALADVGTAQSFDIKASGMTAEQVRDKLTVTNIGAGGTPELIITESAPGTFHIVAKDGFREGSAIILNLGDGLSFAGNDAAGNPLSADIRNASFTVAKKAVNELEFDKDMKEIKSDKIKDLKAPVVDDPNTVEVEVAVPGTYVYTGSTATPLNVGDLVAIYDKTAPSQTTEVEDPTNNITYAKVLKVEDNAATVEDTTDKLVTYETPMAQEVLALPETLPLLATDFVDTTYTGRGDLEFQIPNTTLMSEDGNGYWMDYDHMNLSKDTTLDVGDAIAIMGIPAKGKAADAEETADSVVYGSVTKVEKGATNTTVTFKEITTADIMANTQEYFTKQDANYGEIAQAAQAAGIEKQIEEQAMASGFAQQAMDYLAQTATKTDGFHEAAVAATGNPDIELPSFGDGWDPNIKIPSFAVKDWTIQAKI
ncbi:MAG: hypothetical protein RSB55_09370, partial [Oscillospiraceae bacterium]